jgi:hypothetical protein
LRREQTPSGLNDHLELLHAVYQDACSKCPAEVFDLRDELTIRSRVEAEGMSFLTITLPAFGAHLEKCFQLGFFDSSNFQMFRLFGAIPAFMQGMLSHIFDRKTGRILDDPDVSIYVGAVRQTLYLFKKIELPCSPEREKRAVARFIQIERDFEAFDLPATLHDSFVAASRVLWDNLLGDFSPCNLLPEHGPGATADKRKGNLKFIWREWNERLEPFFPFVGTAYFGLPDEQDRELQEVTFVPEQEERPVKVTLVPKTLKTPRVIAIEPSCNVYVQKALQTELYARLEAYWLTRGLLNFTDQSINQHLALTSSSTGRFVTIDLSDASDRVPHSLAMRMFDGNPDIRDAIESCRSRRAELPTGEVIPLKKFASMGSALCFPVEAMYFFTLCVMAVADSRKVPLTQHTAFQLSRDVYVYGDDIIVPTDEAGPVLDYLQKYNCKVNDSKTFLRGNFRESCGVDAFAGEDVTPTYLRRERPKDKQQVAECLSWVATANLFYSRGYWRTADLMFRTCEKILGPLPYVSPESSALGRVSFLGYRSVERWDDAGPWPLTRAWVPSMRQRSDKLTGYAALTKSLLRLHKFAREDEEVSDRSVFRSLIRGDAHNDHLEQTAPRGEVTLKRRWVPAT